MDILRENLRIAELITRKLSENPAFTVREEQELESWLANKEHQKLYEKLSGEELCVDFEQVTSNTDPVVQWKKLEAMICRKRRLQIARWCSYAAVVVVVLLTGIYYQATFQPEPGKGYPLAYVAPGNRQAVLILNNGEQIPLNEKDTLLNTNYSEIRIKGGQIEYDAGIQIDEEHVEGDTIGYLNKVIVPRGGIYSLILNDGSKVFLNSESELTYPMQFRGKEREVILKGEAFFEVAHRSGQPFVVKTERMTTRVLGTVFNMMAYDDEPEVQTTLLQGKVEVTVVNTSLKEILQPGQQAAWKVHGGNIEVKEINIRLASLWKDGIIMLDDDDLESVMRMLCRWYGVEYVFDDPVSGTHTFTGRIDRNEDLGSVLKTLTLLGGPRFRVDHKVIHILNKK